MSDGKTPGDLCEVRIGRTPRRDGPAYWGGSAVWVTVAELNGGEFLDSKQHISDLAVAAVMAEPVPPGTLLFSFKLNIGKMAVAGVPLYTNEAIAALIIKHGDKLDRDFLRYALMARATQEDGANHAMVCTSTGRPMALQRWTVWRQRPLWPQRLRPARRSMPIGAAHPWPLFGLGERTRANLRTARGHGVHQRSTQGPGDGAGGRWAGTGVSSGRLLRNGQAVLT